MKDTLTVKISRSMAPGIIAGDAARADMNLQPQPQKTRVNPLAGAFCAAVAAAGILFPAHTVSAQHFVSPPSLSREFNEPGNILIADQFNNRVIEASPDGKIIWSYGRGPNDFSDKSVIGVNDSQRVGPLTLIAATGTPPGAVPQDTNGAVDSRIILIDPWGNTLWQYGMFGQAGSGPDMLNTPVQSTWLPNEHVLITDQGNNRIIEVNLCKEIVWSYPGSDTNASDQLNSPNSAELLEDGHILISDENNARVLEVTRNDVIVKTFTASGTLGAVAFASRLKNGHTLMTDAGNSRAVEVDANDVVVWQYFTDTDPNSIPAPSPSRAIRLRDGDTLISDQYNNRVIRVNHGGKIVRSYGLPLDGGPVAPFSFGNNFGYDLHTTQKGLYSPYDAKIVGDYTGLTPPFDFDHDADD